MPLREVRFHGRGGQGAVTSSQVLAIAAFHDGKYTQAFPNFGVERTGAPVESYTRIDAKPINVRQQVYSPDYVIVLDSSLMASVNVTNGLRRDGLIIVNSNRKPRELNLGKFNAKTIDITKTALEVIGKPFVNIAALGAFAALSGEVSLEALNKAVDERFAEKGKIAELNKQACKALFRQAGEGKK
jgi:pyruvate ferredoxin oxidoreductase gamma subunit